MKVPKGHVLHLPESVDLKRQQALSPQPLAAMG
ncbi:hypothetical protein AAULR_23966 [Lacticaseibacillus rhamnosus MTCC 5462]|nr:hypothetical protein AAULR_23966 [Lacticaseibacillus rhamnosus MTCC 5462]